MDDWDLTLVYIHFKCINISLPNTCIFESGQKTEENIGYSGTEILLGI